MNDDASVQVAELLSARIDLAQERLSDQLIVILELIDKMEELRARVAALEAQP